MSAHRTVIIGGGFSGMMVAANLIRKATQPHTIFLVEKTPRLAKGVAYSTPEPYHLLNVPGGYMGAFADDPGHFMGWLTDHQTLWRSADPAFKDLPLEEGRYYPRKLYGVYLHHLWQHSLKEAAQKSITVTVLADEAIDVALTERRTAIITLKKQILPEAGHVVLATGNMPVKSFAYAHGIFLCQDRYIENMWSAKMAGLLRQDDLSALPEDTHIAIVGTGLTMVDAFLSLRHKGYRGNITAISRHGKLPLPHRDFSPYPSFLTPENYPRTARSLVHLLREEARKAAAHGHDWRAVLQALRPDTNALWKHLPAQEQRHIARRLISYWNIHRHRLPPEILALLAADIAAGRLTIIPGTIYYIGGSRHGPMMVSYRKRGEDFIIYTAADYIINCSGPETDIAKSHNRFLLALRDQGIIQIGTVRIGLELTPGGRVKGKAPDIFHAVGALVAGEKLESTAVPDIRIQAAETAGRILSGTPEDYSRYYNYFI